MNNIVLKIRTELFDVSQEELGFMVGVAQATIARWEAGKGEPSITQWAEFRKAAKDKNLTWSDDSMFKNVLEQREER